MWLDHRQQERYEGTDNAPLESRGLSTLLREIAIPRRLPLLLPCLSYIAQDPTRREAEGRLWHPEHMLEVANLILLFWVIVVYQALPGWCDTPSDQTVHFDTGRVNSPFWDYCLVSGTSRMV